MNQKNRIIIIYIMAIWFLISFVTNIIGPLIPIIIKWYKLNYALAGFLPFSFFVAYGIISIPAGFLLERRGQSVTMLGAFSLNVAGLPADRHFCFLPRGGRRPVRHRAWHGDAAGGHQSAHPIDGR